MKKEEKEKLIEKFKKCIPDKIDDELKIFEEIDKKLFVDKAKIYTTIEWNKMCLDMKHGWNGCRKIILSRIDKL